MFHSTTAPLSAREIGPPPTGTTGLEARACGTCHQEIAREWRTSQHAASWSDPIVQAGYAVERRAFCRDCHAPLGDADAEPASIAASDGVSCAVCHVREGRVLGVGGGLGDALRADANSTLPHATEARPVFAESSYCAACHQFDFPRRAADRGMPPEPMQNTFAEWQTSDAAARGTGCQDCHMPWRSTPDGRRWRSHAFFGTGDRAMLSRAVRIDVSSRHEGHDLVVVANLTPGEIGHAFPTGDVFRRLELRAWRDGEEPSLVSFARDFCDRIERDDRGRSHQIRRACIDDRIPAPGPSAHAPIVVELRLASNAETRGSVHWALDYRRVDAAHTASESLDEALVTTRIAQGALEP